MRAHAGAVLAITAALVAVLLNGQLVNGQRATDVSLSAGPTGPSVTVPAPEGDPRVAPTEQVLRDAIGRAMGPFDAIMGKQAEALGLPAEQGVVIRQQVPVGFPTLRRTRLLPDPGPDVSATDPRVLPLRSQPRIEAQVGSDDFLPVRFLEGGVLAAKAVGRVALRYDALTEAGLGTGFMVSPTLFMTNSHVIPSADFAQRLDVQFNYQSSLDGNSILTPVSYELDAASFFDTDATLDYTLVRVKPRAVTPSQPSGAMSSAQAGVEFGFLPLTDRFLYTNGQLANIVQHPNGRPKEIALHNNVVSGIYTSVIRYTTDTENGSSGAPVLNNSWKVIALHHASGDKDAQTGKYTNNEGIRIDVILTMMRARYQPSVLRELGIQ